MRNLGYIPVRRITGLSYLCDQLAVCTNFLTLFAQFLAGVDDNVLHNPATLSTSSTIT